MSSSAAPRLSLVLPVYNEERVLETSLAAICGYAGNLGEPFELVCVDDGSRDRSRAILEEAARDDARIRVLVQPENRGKGAAVRCGMLAATGARAFFLDADLSTPLDEIPAFLAALEAGHDVVLGSRRMPGASITRRQPLLRETLGRGFTALTRALVAPGITDFTCGFKAFTREAAQVVFSRSARNGWAFDAELVAIAQEQGLRIAQLPVRWAHVEDTKVRIGSAVFRSFGELLAISARRSRGLYR